MLVPVGANGRFAVVDPPDYEVVNKFRWSELRVGELVYAVRREGRSAVPMHRQILGAMPGEVVDHADRDGLNNTRSNIRLCSHAENMRNRKRAKSNKSGFKGVYLKATRKDRNRDVLQRPWVASIKKNGKRTNLGYFATPELAYSAYCAAAKSLHGEFARLS